MPRAPSRAGLSSRRGHHSPRHKGSERPPFGVRQGQACGFWRRCPVNKYASPHFRWHTLLDGPRSHQTSGIRCKGRYVELGHHRHRNGQGGATSCGVSPHACPISDPKGKGPCVRGSFLGSFQRLCVAVLDKGPRTGMSSACAYRMFCRHSYQRPTAKELLQHRFIRGARKTSYLTELIERYQEYRGRAPARGQTALPSTRNSIASWDKGTLKSEWNFETIRSTAAMGSFRSMAKDLVRPGVIPDEDEEEVSLFGTAEDGESLDTDAATKGSEIPPNPGGTGSETQAQHNTVVVRSQLASPPGRVVPTEEVVSSETSTPEHTVASVNPDLGAPPAYVRTPRRSSYAARMAQNGTIVREADIGTGVDTIRPVKKIDTTGSLRLSSEYVGSMRARDGSNSGSAPTSPTSPVKDKSSAHKRAASDAAKVARSLVDEVVLPTLQKVGYCIRYPHQCTPS